MFKAIITNAVISKGYNGAEALRFSENNSAVQFKIGERVYDSKAEGKAKYIDIGVKAFGALSERIFKMNFKEGSYINLVGRLDEEKWEDNGQQHKRLVVIADEIEYTYNGGVKSNSNDANSAAPEPNNSNAPQQKPETQTNTSQPTQKQDEKTGTPDGFTGFESFGNENPFFPNEN